MRFFLVVVCILYTSFVQSAQVHRVQSGDTLSKLLIQYHYPFETWTEKSHWLSKFDELNSSIYLKGNRNHLIVGTDIILPKKNSLGIPVPMPVVIVDIPEKEQAIGKLIVEKGAVHVISKNKKMKTVSSSVTLYEGDTVRSKKISKARLTMLDNALFNIGGQTEIQLNRYQYAPNKPSKNKSFVRLVSGVLNAVSGAIGKITPSQYQLVTPVSTIGIRGTDYVVRYCEGHDCGVYAGMSLAVKEGQVIAANGQGEIEVRENQFVQINESGIVSDVTHIPEGFLDLSRNTSVVLAGRDWWDRLVETVNYLIRK